MADSLLRLAAGWPPPLPASLPDVVVVALDPQSLRAHPVWPWPRQLYAEAIERLDAAGARAIALDIDLSTPRSPEEDARLAAAVAGSGRVVLAAFRQRQAMPDGGELEIANLPFAELARAAAAVGGVAVPIDSDGIVRRGPVASRISGETYPSLAQAALMVALGEPLPALTLRTIDVDYRRAQPPIPVISIVDLLEDRFDSRDVAGRVALVGATAVEFQDLWSTPLGPAQPGVWIQAVLVRTLAAARAEAPMLRRAGLSLQLLFLALISFVAAGLGTLSHGHRWLLLAGFASAVVGGSFVAVVHGGLLVDPIAPLGVIGAHYVLGLEGIRRRFGRRLAERELTLSTLFRVGEATSYPADGQDLKLVLALLGDVVDASGVALLRALPNGRLDGERLEWQRYDQRPIGDLDLAGEILSERRIRVFEGFIPGPSSRPGVAVYTPLHGGKGCVGVLVVERNVAASLDDVQLRTIATVSAQLATSAENLRLIDCLRQTFEASLEALATAVEVRDGHTELHCRRLADFSVLMAERLDIPPEEIEAIRFGALLHDIGKVGIPDRVLLKPARLTPEEREEMQHHPEIGRRIVAGIPGIAPTTLDCIYHHHERWDGSGYPDGLAGEAIPPGARILAVVDVWDAMSNPRPYKPAYPQETVRRILTKGKGTQFQPELSDLFFEILDDEGDQMLALIAGLPEDAR